MTAGTYRLVLESEENGQKLGSNESVDELNTTCRIIPVKGIIFDMDGTLTKPQTWMFGEMRRQLNVPVGEDILTHLDNLPTVEDKHDAEMKLRKIEEKAMNEQEPTYGLLDLFQFLSNLKIKTSICTRNVPKPVTDFCKKFLDCDPFDNHVADDTDLITGPVITREFKPPKPAPEPLLHIINKWNCKPEQIIMIGDSLDDMDAGIAAGCAVVLLRHNDNENVEKNYCVNDDCQLDGVVQNLHELSKLLESGLTVKVKHA